VGPGTPLPVAGDRGTRQGAPSSGAPVSGCPPANVTVALSKDLKPVIEAQGRLNAR
jgi:hypothetical protein